MTNAKPSGPTPTTYRDSGVDIDAGNALVGAIKPLVAATRRPGADGAIGGFGGIFDLAKTGYRDPLLVAANDGVGTKLRIAIETGQHDTIGTDLVAMCVNDLVVQGAEPLFFLDYLATGKLEPERAREIIAGIAAGCREAGCALIGGETAEMPGMYHGQDYDLAGFAVGAVEREQVLPRSDIKVGDQLIGLASSGVHSNGYSLVRRLVTDQGLRWSQPAPWDGAQSVAQSLMTPTRIYVQALLSVLKSDVRDGIKALAHITGGGITENVPRVLDDESGAEIDLSKWQLPPVFGWLATAGQLDQAELLRTFNCGLGMIVVCASAYAEDITALLRDAGEEPVVVGTIIDGEGVHYRGGLDLGR